LETPARSSDICGNDKKFLDTTLHAICSHSVIAFSVALREQELAIRMALGCQRKGILHLVLTSAVKLGALGCFLGLLTSTAVSHLLRTFLFGVSPFDPLVLTLSAVAMLSFALSASALPAMRAAKINPIIALRGD
jgi:ABC-type antimicrobial peptide transport system permease subunit